jgi:hypothetical protein
MDLYLAVLNFDLPKVDDVADDRVTLPVGQNDVWSSNLQVAFGPRCNDKAIQGDERECGGAEGKEEKKNRQIKGAGP